MGRSAFVFSGQGDQFPGMGKAFFDRYEEAREMFLMFDRIRPGTSGQCFYGTAEELRDTANTQPCLFAMELAAAEVLKAHRILPDAVAGFSLGEVAACTFAGVFTPAQGFSLVIERGRFMADASAQTPSFMAAVLKLDGGTVDKICHQVKDIWAVNFNGPGQTTVAGCPGDQDIFFEKVAAAGGRVIPLEVSGGFHSPLMAAASARFRRTVRQAETGTPDIPIYSNVTGLPCKEEIVSLLPEQIKRPVLWETLVRNMIRDGIDIFIEIGPGSTLSGLIRKIDPGVRTYTLSELPGIMKAVRSC